MTSRETYMARRELKNTRNRPKGLVYKHSKQFMEKVAATKTKKVADRIVAWDGEGIDNKLVLWAASTGDKLVDVNGLKGLDCLKLIEKVNNTSPKPIHIIFSGSYDFNMILKTAINEKQLKQLWEGEIIQVGDYFVKYLWRKRFMFKPRYIKRSRWITVWDVFGFYQSSFVKAIANWVGDMEGLEELKSMKASRSQFSADDLDAIVHYNELELQTLVELFARVMVAHRNAGLELKAYDGAGATASAVFEKYDQAFYKYTKKELKDEIERAYSGGRIELLRFGHTKQKIYRYDIVSAYPSQMEDLPCFCKGRWEYVYPTTTDLHKLLMMSNYRASLWEIEYDFEEKPFYPLFYRAPDNTISFPAQGCGVYWHDEAVNAGEYPKEINIKRAMIWRQFCNHKPFDYVPELFRLRQQMKKDGMAEEKVLKLALNSLYGKTAQQLGGTEDKPPKYHCLPWAGMITAGTRGKLYRDSLSAGDEVIAFATDAVFTTKPIPLFIGSWLGDYEVEAFDGGTFVQAGVYWLGKDNSVRQWYRGFDEGSLSEQGIIDAYKNGRYEYDATLTRFVGAGSALASKDWLERWCTWYTQERTLNLTPKTKRIMKTKSLKQAATRLLPTKAAVNFEYIENGTVSAPYPLKFDDDVLQFNGEVSNMVVNGEYMDSL